MPSPHMRCSFLHAWGGGGPPNSVNLLSPARLFYHLSLCKVSSIVNFDCQLPSLPWSEEGKNEHFQQLLQQLCL